MVLSAVLLLGVIGLFNQGKDYLNQQDATVSLNRLVSAVDNTYVRREYGASGDNLIPTLKGFNALPDGLLDSNGTTLSHAFGGPITVTSNGNGYSISYQELDDGICNNLAVKYSGNDKSRSGLTSISINGTDLSGEISTNQIAAACNGGDDANTVTWNFV